MSTTTKTTKRRQLGSKNLSAVESSLLVKSIPARLPKSGLRTSLDSRNAISSLESGSGVTHCVSPAGPMTDLFGREVAPVLVSQRQGKGQGLMTLVTSGLIGRDSSASASLQQSLESRLMTQLDTAGSTLFKLTWKGRRTPLGRRYLERAVSVRRTSAKGFTSWPTPRVGNNHGFGNPTRANDGKARLEDFVQASGWWTTPTAVDGRRGNLPRRPTDTGVPLSPVTMSGWATPKAQRPDQDSHFARGNPTIGAQASLTASGETRIGYSARDGIVTIGNGAQLNPEHSRWLQALPIAFSSCADTAMQSLQKSRRRSSKRTSIVVSEAGGRTPVAPEKEGQA